MDLKNSTVLITGGTSGIGLELVNQLTQQGSTIIVTGRKQEALNDTKRRFPKTHVFQSDVSDPQDIERLYKEVTQQFPDLNIIVNNAGEMVHQFLPHLAKKKSAAIVNVSSGIAFMPFSVAPIYSASKAGVRAYTQALRLQLKGTSVMVFEMIPPGVKTNLQKDWVLPPDSNSSLTMEVDKMVNVAIKGLQRDRPELKPFLISVIKWASRIVPGALINFGHKEFERFKQLNKTSN
jgi:uncharacterized oxidoreductase